MKHKPAFILHLFNFSCNMSQQIDIITSNKTSKFYGVYLLRSQSTEKPYEGKCYIGFTVNPNRRIQQHNRGIEFGGAKKTNNKGPWKMILIIHGFPNNIAALQFEWAWQQPSLSSRLKDYTSLKRKRRNEPDFQYKFRILERMLNVGPWQRLPLIIQWLDPVYICQFDQMLQPPSHMQIVIDTVDEVLRKPILWMKQKKIASEKPSKWSSECHLCMKSVIDDHVMTPYISCLNDLCNFFCHTICLANHFLSVENNQHGHYIPIQGECPLCETSYLWIDLIKCKLRSINFNNGEESDEFVNEGSCINLSDEICSNTHLNK